MKILLKQNFKWQTNITKLIQIDSKNDAKVLKEHIVDLFGIPIKEQMITFIKDNEFKIRIVDGFSIEFYDLEENTIVDVDRIANPYHKNSIDIHDEVIIENEEEEEIWEDINDYLQREIDQLIDNTVQDNLQAVQDNFTSCPNKYLQYKNIILDRKKKLMDECGATGWNPFHYAISTGNVRIFKEFLKRTDVNVNLCTEIGTALHIACMENNIKAVNVLLFKHADPNIKNIDNKKPHQMCSDHYIISAIEKNISESTSMVSLTSEEERPIVTGFAYKLSEVLQRHNKRFLVLNPYEGTLIRYKKKEEYPNKPNGVIFLSKLNYVKIVDNSNSWFLYKNINYFEISLLNSEKPIIFGFNYKSTQMKWMSLIYQIQSFVQNTQISEKSITKQFKKKKADVNFKLTSIEAQLFEIFDDGTRKNVFFDIEKSKDFDKMHNINWDYVFFEENKMLKRTEINYNQELIEDKNVTFASFNMLQELGSGAFGKVYLSQKKDNFKLFAMKVLSKKNLIARKRLKYAIAEVNILKNCENPFILKIYYTFQTPQNLYFVLEYCPGGDLLFHLMRKKTFTEDEAKFYVGEIILAIEYLHNSNIIYRDLKPENILLDGKGHIRLADFGLSKDNMGVEDLAMSFCGSPAYLSPEMLQKKGAGRGSDIYQIGAILYELLIGQPAYFDLNIKKMYQNIEQGQLTFPKNISEGAKNLIKKLMNRNPRKRPGIYDKSEIKNDPFFDGIDFHILYNKKYIPPPIEYEEVFNKLQERSISDEIFKDVDYNEKDRKMNRVKNFTFSYEN